MNTFSCLVYGYGNRHHTVFSLFSSLVCTPLVWASFFIHENQRPGAFGAHGFDGDLKLERQAQGWRPWVPPCMVGAERNRSDLFFHPKNYGKLSTVYTSDRFVICSTAGMCLWKFPEDSFFPYHFFLIQRSSSSWLSWRMQASSPSHNTLETDYQIRPESCSQINPGRSNWILPSNHLPPGPSLRPSAKDDRTRSSPPSQELTHYYYDTKAIQSTLISSYGRDSALQPSEISIHDPSLARGQTHPDERTASKLYPLATRRITRGEGPSI